MAYNNSTLLLGLKLGIWGGVEGFATVERGKLVVVGILGLGLREFKKDQE